MIQRYVHPHAAKNMLKIGDVSRFFLYKVIFQSNPLCSDGGYTLRIHWHTYSPRTTRIWPLDSDITFVIMRIYIFLLPRSPTRCVCTMYIAHDARAVLGLHVRCTGFAWPLIERCAAQASIKIRDISISFYRNYKFFYKMYLKLSLVQQAIRTEYYIRRLFIYHLRLPLILQSISKLSDFACNQL